MNGLWVLLLLIVGLLGEQTGPTDHAINPLNVSSCFLGKGKEDCVEPCFWYVVYCAFLPLRCETKVCVAAVDLCVKPSLGVPSNQTLALVEVLVGRVLTN